MKKKIIIRVMVFLLLCLFSIGIKSQVLAASEEETITKGVYIDSVDIGGMTKVQAKEAVDQYIDDLKIKKITITVDDASEESTLEDLGLHYKDNNYLDDALLIGKSGNLIKRYKELKDTEEASLVYNLEFALKKDKVKDFIKEKLSSHDVKAENAAVKRENGAFVYTNHTVGRKVNIKDTLKAIEDSLTEGWDKQDIAITAVVEEDIPKYTRENVEKVKTLLGTFSTTYTTSSSDRAGNLANGARLINNTVLYPGDVFSAYEKLTPFTKANGYYEAGAYANGKVVDSIGGGACQVTTTLYNAVLLSELEVVERAPHSMTVSYVKLSMDSAIAGTWKDLKFKNDKDSPILIEVYTRDRTITFNIWGNETRDTKRTVKYESVVLSETKPGPDVVTKDPTKPESYQITTQSAHTGYVAELYKVVYENGTEVSRTRVNKSVYNASPRYVTVGSMVEEEEVEEEEPSTETSGGGLQEGPTDGTDTGNTTNEKPGKKPTAKPEDNNSDDTSSESQEETESTESIEAEDGV
ncbi:exported protein [Anaerocolumna cellulosilytica]|uniref:Exported protein n=1 Tax=Anaerocolumna cellulosilytica TaxID=433286 RepID=A0A6S6QZ28_9FIRM|nr:VanW family protein [Anaerocolumna cellulosilytica]MBB5196945.1 vancomycin resistance protein YoaR [Anaerocolumna cellulosilytica]BCJ92655.1 exported protein [Anaerocolumna cellulosilytica]